MAISLGHVARSAFKIFTSDSPDRGEIQISPLDGRLPDVSLQEIRTTGKSAAELRVEKGTASLIEHLEVALDRRFSKPGREQG
jgi:hypothetical protein